MSTKKSAKNAHDRDRDNASGRFVSDEHADANPETTTSEAVKGKGTIEERTEAAIDLLRAQGYDVIRLEDS